MYAANCGALTRPASLSLSLGFQRFLRWILPLKENNLTEDAALFIVPAKALPARTTKGVCLGSSRKSFSTLALDRTRRHINRSVVGGDWPRCLRCGWSACTRRSCRTRLHSGFFRWSNSPDQRAIHCVQHDVAAHRCDFHVSVADIVQASPEPFKVRTCTWAVADVAHFHAGLAAFEHHVSVQSLGMQQPGGDRRVTLASAGTDHFVVHAPRVGIRPGKKVD